MNKRLEHLKKVYEITCNGYVEIFCKKQSLDFDFWVGGEVGGIATFACQYSFNLSDIILDLETRQPKGLILDWQSEEVGHHLKGGTDSINYKSYTLNFRHKDLTKKNYNY